MLIVKKMIKDTLNKLFKLLSKPFAFLGIGIREFISDIYIKGNGIEIGALASPVQLSSSAKVKYLDRLPVAELRKQYPELNLMKLVNVDIVDNGEKLGSIKDSTQDFVIANHFLEHCQNVIEAISNLLRVLKKEGILYLAVPDKRFTFDVDRPVTDIEHIIRDYQEGPEWSRKQHFEEWVRLVTKIQDDSAFEKEVKHLMDIDYSIHYHVWSQAEFLELILSVKKILNLSFDIELFWKSKNEVIIILRKK